MNTYSQNDYRDYLQHHGILGMRWGVRRYQNKDGSFTPAGKKRYSGKGNSKISDNNEAYIKQKGLSDSQKRAIMIGLGVLGVSLAAYGTYRIAKSGGFDSIIERSKGLKSGDAGESLFDIPIKNIEGHNASSLVQITEHAKELSEQTGLPLKNEFFSSIEDEIRANPGYDRSKEEWRNNCSHACLNWCLRKFGLDTEALPMKFDESGGLSFGELKSYIKKSSGDSRRSSIVDLSSKINIGSHPEAYKKALADEILSVCQTQNGAFGIVQSRLESGTGHFFAFEINDGVVTFPNPQGYNVSTDNYFIQMANGSRLPTVEFLRMDDKEFIPRRVKEFAKPFSH